MADTRMDMRQAASHLGISLSKLQKMLKAGGGPVHYRIGHRYQFRQSDLDTFLERNRVEPELAVN